MICKKRFTYMSSFYDWLSGCLNFVDLFHFSTWLELLLFFVWAIIMIENEKICPYPKLRHAVMQISLLLTRSSSFSPRRFEFIIKNARYCLACSWVGFMVFKIREHYVLTRIKCSLYIFHYLLASLFYILIFYYLNI
jgi:hypothetical protein